MKTSSYTSKLIQHSQYYKTFSNIIKVRTVSGEYLISMKLMSGRQYKNDLSDIVGILLEQQNAGRPISLDSIKTAATELYHHYENLPEASRLFIEEVYQNPELSTLYQEMREEEKQNKNLLLQFQENYPDVLNVDNLADILKAAKEKRKRDSNVTQ